jgi:hypothetical protein
MGTRPVIPPGEPAVSTRRAPLLIALALALLTAAPVVASDTERERTKQLVARGVFDPRLGWVAWLVNVSPREHKSGAASLFLTASAVNDCTGEDVVGITGTFPLAEGAFAIDGRLDAAALDTTLEATDRVTGSQVTVAIDLDWATTGDPPTRIRFREVTEEPGRRIIVKTERVTFPASAAGTITIGDRSLSLAGPLLADLSEVETETTIVTHD